MIDCGCKQSIINSLIRRNCNILYTSLTEKISDLNLYNKVKYDGILISNGPGDPKMNSYLINELSIILNSNEFYKNIPVFGICLGSQLMGLATGADTYKLKYGHRGFNQPVIDLRTNKCYITSQNHGYAIDEKSLTSDWEIMFKNLNDNTVEGIKHKNYPYFSVQFHPEANGGPTDTGFLFDEFISMMDKKINK